VPVQPGSTEGRRHYWFSADDFTEWSLSGERSPTVAAVLAREGSEWRISGGSFADCCGRPALTLARDETCKNRRVCTCQPGANAARSIGGTQCSGPGDTVFQR
jgi:hypothetical protein